MLLFSLLFTFVWLPAAVLAAFGYTDDGSNYVIDSGAALVIKVSKTTGDITSSKHDLQRSPAILCRYLKPDTLRQ